MSQIDSGGRLADIAEKLRRRAAGDWGAADDVWAETITIWRCGGGFELKVAGAIRTARAKAEAELLRLALPDLRTDCVVHVSEPTSTLVEVTRWTGTMVDVPGSGSAGTTMTFRFCLVHTVRDGKVVRVDTFDDAATGRRWNELMTHTRLLHDAG